MSHALIVSSWDPLAQEGLDRGRLMVNVAHLFVAGFARSPQRSCDWAVVIDREQLQPGCQHCQSAANGTACSVRTGTDTVQDCGQEKGSKYFCCCHMKIPVFWQTFFLYLQLYSGCFSALTGLEETIQRWGLYVFDQLLNTW